MPELIACKYLRIIQSQPKSTIFMYFYRRMDDTQLLYFKSLYIMIDEAIHLPIQLRKTN